MSLALQSYKRSSAVDDCLKSVDDQTAACGLIDKLRLACSKGGFRLIKFTSNSRAVIASTPQEERAKEVICLYLNQFGAYTTRTRSIIGGVIGIRSFQIHSAFRITSKENLTRTLSRGKFGLR